MPWQTVIKRREEENECCRMSSDVSDTGLREKGCQATREETTEEKILDLPLQLRQVVNVVRHSNEQIKEHASTTLHLNLHSATALERVAAADNQSEVMCTESRISLRSIVIGESCTAENSSNLDTRLQSLLTQGKLLKLFEAELLGQAIDGCVPQDQAIDFRTECGHGSRITPALKFEGDRRTLVHGLKNPGVSSAVVE